MPSATKTKSVPARALAVPAACEFAAAGETKDGIRRSPIRLTAVSGQPFDHWYWGRMVIDVDGMASKQIISLDYCHDPDQIVGFGKVARESGQLLIDGELIAFEGRDDRAAEIMAKGAAGVPYEASVKLDPLNGLQLEFYDEDVIAEVNGQQIAGPLTVLRSSLLRGCAICPYGADPNTSSEFSANQAAETELTITIFSQEADMPAKPVENKTPTTPADDAPVAELVTPAADPVVAAPDWQVQLADYTQRFGGELAAKWLGEGKPLVDAYAEFVSQLQTTHALQLEAKEGELKAARDQAAELQSRIDQLSLGEQAPLSSVPAEGNGGTLQRVAELSNALPDGLAKFAADLKMPAKE